MEPNNNPAPQTNPAPPAPAPPVPPAPPAPGPQASPAGAPQLDAVPDKWPGAWGIYKYSKQFVMLNLATLLTLFLLTLAEGIIARFIKSPVVEIPIFLLDILLYGATVSAVVSSVHGNKTSLGDALSVSLKNYIKLLVLLILMGLVFIISFILFIIPALFIVPRIILAPYFLIDQNLGIGDSLQASWDQTKGHAGKVWGLFGVTIVFGILEIVLIGFYFGFIYSAAFGVLYIFITKHVAAAPPPAPVPPTV